MGGVSPVKILQIGLWVFPVSMRGEELHKVQRLLADLRPESLRYNDKEDAVMISFRAAGELAFLSLWNALTARKWEMRARGYRAGILFEGCRIHSMVEPEIFEFHVPKGTPIKLWRTGNRTLHPISFDATKDHWYDSVDLLQKVGGTYWFAHGDRLKLEVEEKYVKNFKENPNGARLPELPEFRQDHYQVGRPSFPGLPLKEKEDEKTLEV